MLTGRFNAVAGRGFMSEASFPNMVIPHQIKPPHSHALNTARGKADIPYTTYTKISFWPFTGGAPPNGSTPENKFSRQVWIIHGRLLVYLGLFCPGSVKCIHWVMKSIWFLKARQLLFLVVLFLHWGHFSTQVYNINGRSLVYLALFSLVLLTSSLNNDIHSIPPLIHVVAFSLLLLLLSLLFLAILPWFSSCILPLFWQPFCP